ncbi:hypothetical protein LSTR_LSTR002889 [Laodelphax striatellus]|uniref:Vitellogenin domain-containing protein n=1 Tax=Laodelphax striatellus TaxID=195883 RepID=A0A482XVZ1_LAOST|nr:hypothetical protein LSTR_LSTR002889 [Laodelphax striatellus]
MLNRLFLGLLLLLVTIERNYAAVAESATESINEVTYELKTGDLHSRQISEEGDSLIIGTQPCEELGSPTSQVTCTKHSNIHDYKDIHRTQVYNRTSHAYKMLETESDPIKIDDKEYFIYIRKELWSCKSPNQQLAFSRVVNHLLGIKEIRGIKYHDGIEVSTKHYLGNGARKTAKIIEVKYFIRNSTGDYPVRYVGKLKKQTTIGGDYIADWISTLRKNSDAHSGRDFISELMMGINEELIVDEKQRSATGIKLILKYAYRKTSSESFGTTESKAVCVQDQGIHPLPKQYRLDFVQVVTHHDKDFEAEIFPEHKSEYFIPVLQEIWLCEMIDKGNKKLFIRVVNEAIALKEVRNVTVHEGVTDLYAIKMHNNKQTIRFREVRYFDAITYAEILYRGKVTLDKRAVIPKEYKGEIRYTLNDNRLYRVIISSEGYDIRVGQKWEKIVSASNADGVECTLNSTKFPYLEKYRMRFRLKAHTVDNLQRTTYTIESLNEDQKQKFISYIHNEVSFCYDIGTNEYKFLRVLNEVSVLVPVHEIELHDGIFVFDKFLDRIGQSKSVRLIEVKYLDIDSKRVVKYDGKVSFKASTSGSPVVFKDINTAMKMTADDIFWKVGHFSNMNVDLVNLASYIEQHPSYSGSMIYNDRGTLVMKLGLLSESQLGTNTDTAECTSSTKDTYFVAAIVKKDNNELVREIVKNDYPNYFRNYKSDVIWTCQLPNMYTPFYQIEDDRILRDTLPENYQNNIFSFTWNQGRYSSVNFVMINDKSYLNFKMTHYFKEQASRYTLHTFAGHVLFDGGEETAKKSGSMLLGKDEEKITMRFDYLTREIEYKVGRDWLYTSKLNDNGVSLYIGHKWKKIFGDSSTEIDCKKVDNVDGGLYDTFYRTRVRNADDLRINGKKRSEHNQVLFKKYFQTIKSEVWLCQKQEQKMLRVLNHFFIERNKCGMLKEIFYHDGVTVLLGPDPKLPNEACTEIVEIKYLDPKDNTVLKFEGRVQLKGKRDELLSNEITARKLKRVAKLEVHYLPKNEVQKTSVDDKGVILEIGVENEKTVYVPQLVCKENKGYVPHHNNQYKPVILINKENAESKIEQETMHIDDIYDCFTYTLSMWDCHKGDGEKAFSRVVNELKPKNCMKIATIFYYDGVIIEKEPDLIIREIKFYQGDETKKTIRVVGFVHLEGAETTQQPAAPTREIHYKLDSRRLHVKAIDKIGPIIEVGSPYEKTFGTKKDAVLCRRVKNHVYSALYKTQMFSNLKGRSESNRPIALSDDQVKQYFQLMKQEIWKCWRNEEETFVRVVNVYVGLKEISRIFHPDGVLIGTQVFPDNKKTVQIREVKYLELGTPVPLKYEGKVTLEAIFSQKATSLFQMPSTYKDYEINLLHPSLVNASTVKYWSLDILVVHAIRSQPTDQILPGIKYQQLQAAGLQQRNTTVIEGAHGIKVEVGSKYDAVFQTTTEMKCMLDEWNPTDEKRFLTKIKLHFDNEFYELDSDTILEYFDINSIEVWICVNDRDTLLRVVTRLTGVKEVYMVIRHDGVEFHSITLPNNGISVNITETKYLDTKDFKVLKYEGDFKMINRMEKPPIEERNNVDKNKNDVLESKTVTAVAVQQPTEIAPPSRFNTFSRLGSWVRDKWNGWNG